MPAAAGYGDPSRIRFAVEQETEGKWLPVEAAIEARSALQAVARAASGEGRFRVRPAEALQAEPEIFEVPPWGPPEPEGDLGLTA